MRETQVAFPWRRTLRAMTAIACGLFFAFHSSSIVGAEAGYRVDDIRNAWLKRQESSATYQLSWDTVEFAPKGSYVSEARGRGGIGAITGAVPPEDVVLHRTGSLLVEGERFRYVEQGEYWRSTIRAFAKSETTQSYDGAGSYKYTDSLDGEYQNGTIGDDLTAIMGTARMVPAVLAICPITSKLTGIDLQDYELIDQSREMDGHGCIVLEKVSRFGRRVMCRELWVEPGGDFLVRRVVSRRDDILLRQTDISYETDSRGRISPKQWKEMNGLPPEAGREATSIVSRLTLSPAPQPSSFQIVFPVGTLVFDKRNAHRGRYLVLPQGAKRPVLDAEIDAGISVEVLKATKPGEPLKNAGK